MASVEDLKAAEKEILEAKGSKVKTKVKEFNNAASLSRYSFRKSCKEV
jgi:hypothetical protein